MKQKFVLEPDDQMPGINFDPTTGNFQLWGRSIPHNAELVFTPLMDWLEQYLVNPAPNTRLEFHLDYFNTSTQKYLAELFRKLDRLKKSGNEVQIIWSYDHEDEDMRLIGDQFQMLVSVRLEFKAY
jgi:hypothetical protein